MTDLTVVNVGDGACAVLRCDLGLCGLPVAVIDCGTWRGSAPRAAQQLADVLGAGLGQVRQLVVTHFDQDHWGGLQALAPLFAAARAGLPRVKVEIFYPSAPADAARLPAGTLAFVSAATATGVRVTELATAWRAVADVVLTPLNEGDTFELAGRGYEVLWPPTHLPPALGRSVQATFRELDALADELADAGYPHLRDNLREAYPLAFPNKDDVPVDGSGAGAAPEPRADVDQRTRRDRPGPASFGFDPEPVVGLLSEPEDDPSASSHDLDDLPVDLFPDDFRPRLVRLARRLGRANNLLSLVFHDEDGRLAVFGDAQDWALDEAVRRAGPAYDVVLAPHHGTVRVPPGFPTATTCVAQAGSRHRPRWARHLSGHLAGVCVSTADVGHVFVP